MDITDSADLHFAWYHRVIPLLQNILQDNARLQCVTWQQLPEKIETKNVSSDISGNSLTLSRLTTN